MGETEEKKEGGASSNEEAEFARIFKRFDTNGDGKISSAELGDALRTLGSASAEEVQRMMWEIDTDGDGFIDFREFQAGPAGSTDSVQDRLDRPIRPGLDCSSSGTILGPSPGPGTLLLAPPSSVKLHACLLFLWQVENPEVEVRTPNFILEHLHLLLPHFLSFSPIRFDLLRWRVRVTLQKNGILGLLHGS